MDKKIKKGILIAYGELFLKSPPVQEFFKKKLIQNISFFLEKAGLDFKIYPFRERIFIEVLEGEETKFLLPLRFARKTKKAIKIINDVFGIAWQAEALFFEKADLKEIADFISENYQEWIKKNETFALRLRKQGKTKQSTEKIINQIALKIKRKVDLTKPKKEIFIEIRKQGWYLYFKKNKGLGGMPNGASGKVLALISGGIDSLPASYLIAKRGARNIWLHFHSFPLVSKKSIDKTKDLAKVFLNYQPGLKVYFFPFSKIQTEIKLKVLAKYRILLYRRLMLKIAQEIAKKENCLALVTGESLAQVSSQTLTNINVTEKATSCLILRPLIGMDKEEIIKLAKKIKTFSISIKYQEDCCTLFSPKHASAKASLKEIEKIEKQLNLNKLIKQAFQEIEIVQF